MSPRAGSARSWACARHRTRCLGTGRPLSSKLQRIARGRARGELGVPHGYGVYLDALDRRSLRRRERLPGCTHIRSGRQAVDFELMRESDRLHTDHPFAGARMPRDMLRLRGYRGGRRHVGRLMGIEALYGAIAEFGCLHAYESTPEAKHFIGATSRSTTNSGRIRPSAAGRRMRHTSMDSRNPLLILHHFWGFVVARASR